MGKRVLMLAPTSFFSDYGCHVRILEEIRFLQTRGFEITVCAYRKGRDVEGIEVYRIPRLPGDDRYELGATWLKVAFDVFLGLEAFAVSFRKRFDLVHSHLHEGALIGYFLSRFWSIPLVFDFQGSMTDEMIQHGILKPQGILYRAMRRLERFIDRLPDVVVTSSSNGARLLVEDFGCPPEKVVELPDCVNVNRFRPRIPADEPRLRELKAGLGIPPDRKVVVYLGLLSAYQGTDLLLEAAARLVRDGRRVHFLVMGFPGFEEYRAKAERMGIGDYVSFPGRIPYFQAPEYLRLGDVAVAPKLSASEGHGKVLVYMATGLPVVAFDRPVNREYLGDLGFYARPGDAFSLADALARALDGAASGIGERLRERAVSLYSWEKAGEKLLEIYSSLGVG